MRSVAVGRRPELAPQVADVGVDAAVERRELPAQDALHQLVARDHPPGAAQQQVEQIELDRRQVERLIAAPRDPRALVDRDVADHERDRRRAARSTPVGRDRRRTASMRALSSRGLNGLGR